MSTATRVEVRLEEEVDADLAAEYYDLYAETFGDLAAKAAARQLLHRDEFLAEMVDHRVAKFVARGADGAAVGLSTATRHLETVPWISPEYFTHRFPELAADGRVYYLGFTLVRQAERRSRVFHAMVAAMLEWMGPRRSVVAWDICSHNDVQLSFGANIERLLGRTADVTVAVVDQQTYYTGTFNEPENVVDLVPHQRRAAG